jgi:hypothetical protein
MKSGYATSVKINWKIMLAGGLTGALGGLVIERLRTGRQSSRVPVLARGRELFDTVRRSATVAERSWHHMVVPRGLRRLA